MSVNRLEAVTDMLISSKGNVIYMGKPLFVLQGERENKITVTHELERTLPMLW